MLKKKKKLTVTETVTVTNTALTVNVQLTYLFSLDPSIARTTSRAIAAKFEDEIIRLKNLMYSHGHETTVFVMWHYRLFVSN